MNTTVLSGHVLSILIYSIDASGKLLDNSNDVFSIQFAGPVSIHASSLYQRAGLSLSNSILTKSGTYTLSIKLYDTHIKGSPTQLLVIPGRISSQNSFILNFPTEITAGNLCKLEFFALDSFKNIISDFNDHIDFKIKFVDNLDYQSPIGIPPPEN